MSQISLTYNPVEDRMLLIVSNNINHPQWWLTRHMCKKLLEMLNAELTLQYELDKIQSLYKENKTNQETSFADKHQQALHDAAGRTEIHKKSTPAQPDALLTTRISLDKKPDNLVALYVYSRENHGICLDLDNNGLHIFLDMMLKVAIKGEWGLKQARPIENKLIE